MSFGIVLIGPSKAGKTTLAKLLAQRLGVEHRSLDEERWRYMHEIGYDGDLDRTIREAGGFLARALYWQLFGAYVVERFLEEHPGCVLDFGAGHTVYDTSEQLARVERALSFYPNVFLILPSPDPDESVRTLNQRLLDEGIQFNFDFSAHFVRHPSNYLLAKHVVYTSGKTPQQTADEIIELLDGLLPVS